MLRQSSVTFASLNSGKSNSCSLLTLQTSGRHGLRHYCSHEHVYDRGNRIIHLRNEGVRPASTRWLKRTASQHSWYPRLRRPTSLCPSHLSRPSLISHGSFSTRRLRFMSSRNANDTGTLIFDHVYAHRIWARSMVRCETLGWGPFPCKYRTRTRLTATHTHTHGMMVANFRRYRMTMLHIQQTEHCVYLLVRGIN